MAEIQLSTQPTVAIAHLRLYPAHWASSRYPAAVDADAALNPSTQSRPSATTSICEVRRKRAANLRLGSAPLTRSQKVRDGERVPRLNEADACPQPAVDEDVSHCVSGVL